MKARFFHRFKKTTVALAVAGLGFAAGTGIFVYAHAIPGIDKPFDPPNYYSLTSISWADTANPSFFYRDVGWQGGQVYDLTRKIKSALYDEKFAAWLEVLFGKNKIAEDDSAQLSNGQKQAFMEDYSKASYDLSNSAWHETEERPKAFDREYYDGLPTRDLDFRETSTYLSDGYQGVLEGTAAREAVTENIANALYTALQNSNNAIGETQADQAKSQIDALKQLAMQALTQSIGAQTQLRQIHELQSLSDKQQQEETQSHQRLLFLDPRDPDDKVLLDSFEKETGYKIYQSKPMPDFH